MADDLSRDLDEAADEPLLPAEVKLVTWSLVLGVVLLGLLLWVSNAFFGP